MPPRHCPGAAAGRRCAPNLWTTLQPHVQSGFPGERARMRDASCRRPWSPRRVATLPCGPPPRGWDGNRDRRHAGTGGHVCGHADAATSHAAPGGAVPAGVDWALGTGGSLGRTPSRAVRRRLTCLTRHLSPKAAGPDVDAAPGVDRLRLTSAACAVAGGRATGRAGAPRWRGRGRATCAPRCAVAGGRAQFGGLVRSA